MESGYGSVIAQQVNLNYTSTTNNSGNNNLSNSGHTSVNSPTGNRGAYANVPSSKALPEHHQPFAVYNSNNHHVVYHNTGLAALSRPSLSSRHLSQQLQQHHQYQNISCQPSPSVSQSSPSVSQGSPLVSQQPSSNVRSAPIMRPAGRSRYSAASPTGSNASLSGKKAIYYFQLCCLCSLGVMIHQYCVVMNMQYSQPL